MFFNGEQKKGINKWVNCMSKRKGTGRQRSRKRRSGFSRYKRSVLMICTVLVFLSGVLAVNSLRLQAKNAEYIEQEEELQSQIDDEKKRSEEVAAFREYVKTDDYVKETAEEKLDLVDPNEIIFKPAE